MKNNLTFLPIPIGCVGLGFAGLGLLFQKQNIGITLLFGAVSVCCLVLLFLKFILLPDTCKKVIKNPIELSTLCGSFMAMMLLSIYAENFLHLHSLAIGLWTVGILGHLMSLVIFFLYHVLHFSLSNVQGSWYIVFVGIAASAIPSAALGVKTLAYPLFLFALVCFVPLTILLGLRCARFPVAVPQKPLLCICAAPASLCIAGYVQAGFGTSVKLMNALYIAAILLYGLALLNLVEILWKHHVYMPSHAAFTFPFVISATASNLIAGLEDMPERIRMIARVIFPIQKWIAVILCCFVLWEYIKNVFLLDLGSKRTKKPV